jgi:hypothetical protein
MTVLGSAGLRLLYGFLMLYLAFAIRSNSLSGGLLGIVAGPFVQLALVGAAFGLGTLIANAVGTALRVVRPMALQVSGLVMVGLSAIYATVWFGMTSVLLLCLCTAVASGLAKVAVDAAIGERIPERDRADAFARTDTLLMLTWLAGAAIGLVPGVPVRLGIAAATLVGLAAITGAVAATWQRRGGRTDGTGVAGTGQPMTGVLLHSGYGPRALPPAGTTISPAGTPTDASAPEAAFEAPPGYHVFRPSPPSVGDPPEAPVSPPASTAADGA